MLVDHKLYLLGIVNGAVFRRFTFRQVAMTGSILGFIGIVFSAFCNTFTEYILCISIFYGFGLGFCLAANSLAVNTYFKNRRRRATGFSWTLTGLGPIIFPHISTMLLAEYGLRSTILIYAALSMNAFAGALTLQPVLWHTKKVKKAELESKAPDGDENTTLTVDNDSEYECKYCQYISAQYLINETSTPLVTRNNASMFGSKVSLSSELGSRLRLNKYSAKNLQEVEKTVNTSRPQRDLNRFSRQISEYSKADMNNQFHCTCEEEKALLQQISAEERQKQQEEIQTLMETDEKAHDQLSFLQKIIKFFDLDLLKDFTFVNLALGMTIMMFGESNFSILTPFILNSYGYTDSQISLAMSILAGTDISVRFLAPLLLEKVKINNKILFAIGMIINTFGRFVVTNISSYNGVLVMFAVIGVGKGFRTIFSPLIIPSYVPLKRLPAASGMQLMFTTFFMMIVGPLLGKFFF